VSRLEPVMAGEGPAAAERILGPMNASLAPLLAWNALTGERWGSEAQSIWFYAYCKMRRPETALELGTGLGHSAFWIARAMEENGAGHIWTVENGAYWPQQRKFLTGLDHDAAVDHVPGLDAILADLVDGRTATTGDEDSTEHVEFTKRVAEALGVASRVTILAGTASLADTAPVTAESQPFLTDAIAWPIDLLYSDFDHAPDVVLAILGKYLPLMSESASIFIDSAATYLPAHLVLEQTVAQLNGGKVPAIFLAGASSAQRDRIHELVATRRFRYMPLPERRDRLQNGLAWLQIEPVNVVPYPLTQVRGLSSSPVSGEGLEAFFARGTVPGGRK
jgi:hypothetical protein